MNKIWRFYRAIFRANAFWFRLISLWAIFWILAGFFVSFFMPGLVAKVLELLDKVFADIFGEGELILNFEAALAIFRQNFSAVALSLGLGVIFGLVPLAAIAFNFFLLGVLFAIFVSGGLSGIGIFLLTILPHGILEIPALLIAGAFGLKLGFSFRNWRATVREIMVILPLLAVLLFLAGMIEVFITGNLAKLLE